MAAPKGNQYAKGKATGRPKIWTDEAIEEEANALLEFIANDEGLYINSFCRKRRIDPDRLPEWARSNEVFAGAFKEAKAWQEEKFMQKALTREWESGFARYAMARTCGEKWKASWDKDDKETKSSDLLEFLAQLMLQAKAKGKSDADAKP